jgi:hypothetical protein
MDKCGICKKYPLFKNKIVDAEYLVHVKTSHGIEPEKFVSMMNEVAFGKEAGRWPTKLGEINKWKDLK